MDIAAILDSMTGAGRVLTVPWGIDYFSIIVGAITGALFACERKLDTVGTVVLGLITAYGGGLIRDVILQDEGVYFTEHPDLIVICILLCLFVFYFRGLFKNLDRAVMLADTLSVALFALAGASKAFAAESGIVVSIILGAITAVGGGAVRDICVGEIPAVFQRSNYYAVAGLGGAAVYVALAQLGCPLPVAGVLCVATVVCLRYASVKLGLKTKQEADFAPAVLRGIRKLRGKGGDGTVPDDDAALNDSATLNDGAAPDDGAALNYGAALNDGAAPDGGSVPDDAEHEDSDRGDLSGESGTARRFVSKR